MKRLISVVLQAIGIVIAVILVIAFASALANRQSMTGSLSQAPQSPLASPTALSTLHPKPSPVTPPVTIPLKPSTPASLTLTPFPSSPLATPTPYSSPTLPVPTITFPPSAAITTVTGNLPSGMKLIYGETDGSTGTTTIWLANATLEARKQLITLVHKVGYTVEGTVSPDGTKIAYLTIPPNASEQAARTQGGELWVMNANGTDAKAVGQRIGHLAMWSPDSTRIIYSRLVALEKPKNPQVPFQTEIYAIDADGTNQKLLLSDDTAYGIYPVGWSADNKTFYYAKAPLQGHWELWGIDIASGLAKLQSQLPYSIIQSFQLSPDGTKLLVTAFDDKSQHVLAVLSVDGQQHEIIASGTTGDQPINQYTAVWSPDGEELLTHIPSSAGHPGGLNQVNVASNQTTLLQKEELNSPVFYSPQSWSPDGEWVILLQYPRPQSLVYLQNLKSGSSTRLPLAQESNWITPLGWTAQGN